MSRNHNFNRGPSSYRRGRPQFPPSGKAFLIVTEGEKTEPNYFKILRARLQLNAADVEIVHPEGTDPITLTNRAIQLRKDRQHKAKRGLEIPYDEVWVVFDLERQHDERRSKAKQAMAMKEAAGIRFAQSDPSFEFWLYLHYDYTTSFFADSSKVEARLKRDWWPNYCKGILPPAEFIEKLPTAVGNAIKCRKHHADVNGNGNPSTQVDRLCRELNSATRANLQFELSDDL